MALEAAEPQADDALVLRQLFEASCDPICLCDEDGALRLVNPAFAKAVDHPVSELTGAALAALVHPEDRSPLAKAAPPGVVRERELRLRTASGWRWFAVRRQAAAGGQLMTFRDAGDQRARRSELEEGRRTRKLVANAAGVGMWRYEPERQEVWWSDELLAMTGRTRADISTPQDVEALLHPKDAPRVRRQFGEAIRTGARVCSQHRIQGPNGWLWISVTVLTEPRPGGVYALQGIAQNVTDLVEARDAARRREAQMRKARRDVQVSATRLKLALEVGEAGVYEIDYVKQKVWGSRELKRLTGRRMPTFKQARAFALSGFHPEDLAKARASSEARRAEGHIRSRFFEARVATADRGERWMRVFHEAKLGRDGQPLKAVGLVQDCDALKRQELALQEARRAAEAAAEAKSDFLANMSHEIRTPLNGVMGVLHLLKSESLTAEGRALLDEAVSCGEMLAELLNDVIDFSKIEAGRLELAYEPVDPTALAEGVARLLTPQATGKGLRLHVESEPALGWVRSDAVRLRQALFNLAGNAVKFTHQGEVSIRCRRPSPGRLRFEVQDTGIGIAPSAQARLFQRFTQADSSTTRRFGGSGLGLAITQRLAELMHGEVGFTSEEGRGSTFWLEVAADPTEPVASPGPTRPDLLSGLRILVVEDNATNRMIATKLLEQLGAEVTGAADGYLGVEAAQAGSFDLILMDVQMPGIDGLEAARRIRALGGRAAKTPIVALTADVLSHQRQTYLEAGMDGVVGKPISPAVLVAEIGRAVEAGALTAADDAAA